MKTKKYIMLVGSNLTEEHASYAIIYDLTGYEISNLMSVLLKKDIEILIRPQEELS